MSKATEELKALAADIDQQHMASRLTNLVNAVLAELEQAQAACQAKDAALKHWQRYFQADVPTNADASEAQGEDFTLVWTETEQALATDCGAALLDRLKNAEAERDKYQERCVKLDWEILALQKELETLRPKP